MRSSLITFLLFALAAMALVSCERLAIRRKLKRDVPSASTVNIGATASQEKDVVSSQGILKSGGRADVDASISGQEKAISGEISTTSPVNEQEQRKMDVPAGANVKVSTSNIQTQSIVDTSAGDDQTQATSEEKSSSASEEGSLAAVDKPIVSGEEKTTLQGVATNTPTEQAAVNGGNTNNSPAALVAPV